MEYNEWSALDRIYVKKLMKTKFSPPSKANCKNYMECYDIITDCFGRIDHRVFGL